MHENLKTTFSLKEENNLSNTKDTWQLLIPDYHFGTFFTLYGRFRGKCIGNDFYPKECDLHLQNYNGILTIGLVRIEPINIAYDDALKKPVYILKVHVKAAYANEQLLNLSLGLMESTSIENYEDNLRDEYQVLLNNRIDCNFNLRIEIIFDPLGQEYFDKKNLSNSLLVDVSKYARDGDQLLRSKYGVYDPNSDTVTDLDDNENEGHGNRGMIIHQKGIIYDDRCNPKYVKLLT